VDEAFPVVVEPEVLSQHFMLDDEYDLRVLRCSRCNDYIVLHDEFSIIHLLYMVKKHLKECTP